MAFYVDFEAGEDGVRTGDEDGDSDMSMEVTLPSRLPSSSRNRRGSGNGSVIGRHLKRVNTLFSSSGSESESDDTTPNERPKDGVTTTEHPKDATERPKDGVARTERRKQRTPLQKLALHPSQLSGGGSETLLAELKKSNVILTSLVKRVKSTESRMKVIEEKVAEGVSTPSSSGSLSTPKRSRTRDVPPEVRRETRRVYRMLIEEDVENFSGWKIEPGTTYKDPQNQIVLSRLVREVKALNSTFLTQHIKDAAYRFYRSGNEEESAKRRGKLPGKNKNKRKHERLVRKFQERKAMFEKGSYQNDEEKHRWRSILSLDLMSSDESGLDDGKEVITSHPLPWLSSSVDLFKRKLDEAILKEKSPQSKRQMKERVQGSPFSCPCHHSGAFPSWVLKN